MIGLFVICEMGGGPMIGAWLESFDVDAHDGRGAATFTRDPSRALRFADHRAALATWKTRSRVRPWRDDGKPNRPLTAYTCEVKPL